MYRLVLQGAYQFEAGTITDVTETPVGVRSKCALHNKTVVRSVEKRSPALEFEHALRRLLGKQLCHAPVIDHLAAPHRIGEVTCQLSSGSTLPSDAAMPPSAITVCAFPRSDLQTTPTEAPASDAATAARRPAPPAPITSTSCSNVSY